MTAEQTWQQANDSYLNGTTTEDFYKAGELYLSLKELCTDPGVVSVMTVFAIQAGSRASSLETNLENAYKTFSVTNDISSDELATKYNELEKIWNPNPYINDPDKFIKMETKHKEIINAFQTITDPSYALKNSIGDPRFHNDILRSEHMTFATINGEGEEEAGEVESSGKSGGLAFIGLVLLVVAIISMYIHPVGTVLFVPALLVLGKQFIKSSN